MIKILLLTAMHKRPEISELFCISAKNLMLAQKDKYDITVCSMVSDPESEQLCNRYGIHTLNTVEKPLGTKMNQGYEMALRRFDFDYLLSIDDDDVFSPDILNIYSEAFEKRLPYFGVKSVYFLDYATNRAMLFKYVTDRLIGPGRVIRRDALESTGYRSLSLPLKDLKYSGINAKKEQSVWLPDYQAIYLSSMKYSETISGTEFRLFDPLQVRGLNMECEMNLLFNNYYPAVIETPKPIITDVKSQVNIWGYETFSVLGDSVTVSEATYFWSSDQKEYLHNLSKNILKSKQ
jgi:hypothetical protein